MHISRRTEYALLATVEIASNNLGNGISTRSQISYSQKIPSKFLATILRDLKSAEIITSIRGSEGGYKLKRHPKDISLAEIIRATSGALTLVGGDSPDSVTYKGSSRNLAKVWIKLRQVERELLENLTIADLLHESSPEKP